MSERRYLVELHDVAADDPGVAERMLGCVPPEAREGAAVLVVPNWQGRARWRAGSPEVSRVQQVSRTPVLHGCTHSLGPRWLDMLWFGTEDEGEFARLAAGEAGARLGEALRAFGDAFGVAPRWFCAPRWQLSAAAREVVAQAGMGLLERDAVVTPDGQRVESPALWFDDGVRAMARAAGSVQRAWRARRVLDGAGGTVRIALHPRDVEDCAARRAIDALFERLERDCWHPTSLEALSWS